MIRTAKLLLLSTVISLSAAYASSQPLLTTSGLLPMAAGLQGYDQGQGQVITCSSDDGRRNYCNVDTRRGVRLSRQISGSACVETQTWGYDNRGIWVDRGCRAEFVVNSRGGNWSGGGGGGQGQVITCSSDNGRRNYCQVSGDLRRINLTRQISGSPCVQNQTWGVDNRGLWVDRGCRAEFSFDGGGGGGGWRPGQGQGQRQTITCSSDDGRRNFCSVSGYNLNSVVLTRQISGSPCVQNDTWGVDRRRGLWVDRGCRAEFQINR
ncbi:MAG: hypothetical protein JWQ42_800 [Edaphobacter sp.]|nr:hypothetical protein [Edaphobacter sp.]